MTIQKKRTGAEEMRLKTIPQPGLQSAKDRLGIAL